MIIRNNNFSRLIPFLRIFVFTFFAAISFNNLNRDVASGMPYPALIFLGFLVLFFIVMILGSSWQLSTYYPKVPLIEMKQEGLTINFSARDSLKNIPWSAVEDVKMVRLQKQFFLGVSIKVPKQTYLEGSSSKHTRRMLNLNSKYRGYSLVLKPWHVKESLYEIKEGFMKHCPHLREEKI